MVVDKTIQATSQVVYALVGLGLLAFAEAGQRVIPGALVVLVVLGAGIYGFYRQQRAGLFGRLARIAGRMMWWNARAEFTGSDSGGLRA